jgi:DNA integrity scanning protein DisA with diadenylate cyclase activity
MNQLPNNVRSAAALAQMVVRVAGAAEVSAILCVTKGGALPQHVASMTDAYRLIASTTSEATYETLTEAGFETLRLPLQAANRYGQVRHAIAVALRSGSISLGDLIVCALGRDLYPGRGNLIVVADVEPSIEKIPITEFMTLTDGVRPRVMEATLLVASKLGRVVRRGSERLGAIFILGDSLNVLEGSRQLVPNPFRGHEEKLRRITNPDIHDALVELAKLDGAFVLRGDGYIQSAGVYLAPVQGEVQLPAGLGARHMVAAAATVRTAAMAIVVSATDGNIRAFSQGEMVLQLDPDVPHGLITVEE